MHHHHSHHGRHDRSCAPHGGGGWGRHGSGHRHGGPSGEGPFGGNPFGGAPFGGGRGGGRRRLFDNEALKLILLSLIAESPRHGYDLIREIESRSGAVYAPSPGVVYPTLTLLADMGLIAEQPGESSRKLFALTDEGRQYLADNVEAVAAATERLAALARKAERTDAAPIRRAMQNLAMAVHARLEKDGADAQIMFDVAALIDEAARKVERHQA